ncbi:hypothetical protein Hdeb2414_s0012g00376391 [Helianthus debilis subsp. tardiflorus]
MLLKSKLVLLDLIKKKKTKHPIWDVWFDQEQGKGRPPLFKTLTLTNSSN